MKRYLWISGGLILVALGIWLLSRDSTARGNPDDFELLVLAGDKIVRKSIGHDTNEDPIQADIATSPNGRFLGWEATIKGKSYYFVQSAAGVKNYLVPPDPFSEAVSDAGDVATLTRESYKSATLTLVEAKSNRKREAKAVSPDYAKLFFSGETLMAVDLFGTVNCYSLPELQPVTLPLELKGWFPVAYDGSDALFTMNGKPYTELPGKPPDLGRFDLMTGEHTVLVKGRTAPNSRFETSFGILPAISIASEPSIVDTLLRNKGWLMLLYDPGKGEFLSMPSNIGDGGVLIKKGTYSWVPQG